MAAKKRWKYPGANANSEYHGLYLSWHNMLQRVGNKDGKNPTYSDVTVCERWLSYDNFYEDMNETWEKGLAIDKDSIKSGNRVYCPEYCKWVTPSENTIERNNRLGMPVVVMTDEIRAKIRAAHLKNKYTKNTKYAGKKVKCVETGEIFDCARDAEKEYNYSEFSVSNAANPNHHQRTAGGYHWEYVEE